MNQHTKAHIDRHIREDGAQAEAEIRRRLHEWELYRTFLQTISEANDTPRDLRLRAEALLQR